MVLKGKKIIIYIWKKTSKKVSTVNKNKIKVAIMLCSTFCKLGL